MMNMQDVMSGWMGAWMWTPSVLLVIVLVAGVFAVVRVAATTTPREMDNPLTIAGRRLARGEITKDEYEQLRSALGRS